MVLLFLTNKGNIQGQVTARQTLFARLPWPMTSWQRPKPVLFREGVVIGAWRSQQSNNSSFNISIFKLSSIKNILDNEEIFPGYFIFIRFWLFMGFNSIKPVVSLRRVVVRWPWRIRIANDVASQLNDSVVFLVQSGLLLGRFVCPWRCGCFALFVTPRVYL